jgi:hypothetical protein
MTIHSSFDFRNLLPGNIGLLCQFRVHFETFLFFFGKSQSLFYAFHNRRPYAYLHQKRWKFKGDIPPAWSILPEDNTSKKM